MIHETKPQVPSERKGYVACSRHVDPHHRFLNFVSGACNRIALEAIEQLMRDQHMKLDLLYVKSEPGLGKTHLLTAIAKFASSTGSRIAFLDGIALGHKIRQALTQRDTEAMLDAYCNFDAVIIDDVDLLPNDVELQDNVCAILDRLFALRKPVIVAGRPSSKFASERLLCRLQRGTSVTLGVPSERARAAILRWKALEKGWVLPDSVVQFFAHFTQDNVRNLEHAVANYIVFSRIYPGAPPLEIAKKAVAANARQVEAAPPVQPRKVVEAVARHFEVDAQQICGSKRSRRFSVPRQIAMYLLREDAKLPFIEIGEMLGNRSYSTAIYACQKVRRELSKGKLTRPVTQIQATYSQT